jgi:DNA processing protein
LVEAAGSVEAATKADRALLRSIEGIGSAKADQIARSLKAAAELVPQELDRTAQLGVQLVCRDDDNYPLLLKGIQDPPSVLYVKGTLEPRDLEALAIVGSRRCSHYGREQAERFGALLAGAGMTMVSGGARGIDSAAHRGALSHADGRTIAVLGCGIDVVYPPENTALFEQIAARGAVMSEFPIATPPNAENFPRRNRIVSGMSRGVLVVEADIRSGALITARLAGEDHGRPVMALPGRVDNAMSAGPHQLIRDGATLVTSLGEILEALSPLPDSALQQIPDFRLFPETNEAPAPAVQVVAPSIAAVQQQILDAMDGESVAVDQIIERTNLDASVVLKELTLMSLKGLVKRVDGQTYVRRK